MNIEYECTLLEINREELIKKLEAIGASKKGEYLQRRYTYDFQPTIKNKWLRLRTNGQKTTLTIKNITDKTLIGGTKELEIEVEDFDKTNLMLEELGYVHKNYQENKRTTYQFENIEIDIDKWPLIPLYAEIEGHSEEEVKDFIKKLDLNYKVTNLDVTSIYNEIYNIDILSIKDLKFEE